MSDDTRDPAEGGETREAEVSTETQDQESQVLSEVEEKARAAGWKPEAEYTGPKGGYVSAQMFLDRGDLYDQLRAQKSAMKRMEKTVNIMAAGFSQQVKAQVALRVKELTEDRKAAIVAGDVQAVEQLDAEIAAEKSAVKETAADIPEEVSEWIQENPWFEKNPTLKAFAMAHNQTYVAANKDATVAESLAETAKAVKKAYPEEFGIKPKPKSAPNPVEGGEAPKDDGGKKKYSVKRLSPDQQLVYKQMVEQHKILSHEDYFKGLEEIGELV